MERAKEQPVEFRSNVKALETAKLVASVIGASQRQKQEARGAKRGARMEGGME